MNCKLKKELSIKIVDAEKNLQMLVNEHKKLTGGWNNTGEIAIKKQEINDSKLLFLLANSCGRTTRFVREFDRMWLNDEMPKFSETIVLSLLHKFLKASYPSIKKLISYSDTSVGNNGTIYRAGNYKEIGRVKADFYILENGERVHPVSM
jgi:hypothetical protein